MVRDQWVRMSDGQFFQIQTEVSDQVNLEPLLPQPSGMGQPQIDHSDNPYASFDLEEASRSAELQQRLEEDARFAETTNPMSGIFDENQVSFGLEAPDTMLHTNAIFASAVLRGTGEALPMTC